MRPGRRGYSVGARILNRGATPRAWEPPAAPLVSVARLLAPGASARQSGNSCAAITTVAQAVNTPANGNPSIHDEVDLCD
jgi:hypothetical protein